MTKKINQIFRLDSFFSLLTMGALCAGSPIALAGVDPTVSKLKIYGVAVSTSADCTNAKVVGVSQAGTEYDFQTSPALATGTIAAGTYNCVILYMDARLEFKPASTTGSCTGGQTYKRALCSADNSCLYTDATPNASNILVYGSEVASLAADSLDEANAPKVLLFLSTIATGNGDHAFNKPDASHLNYGLPLTSPLVVSASGGAGTFVVDFRGQVDGSFSDCTLGPPIFGFR